MQLFFSHCTTSSKSEAEGWGKATKEENEINHLENSWTVKWPALRLESYFQVYTTIKMNLIAIWVSKLHFTRHVSFKINLQLFLKISCNWNNTFATESRTELLSVLRGKKYFSFEDLWFPRKNFWGFLPCMNHLCAFVVTILERQLWTGDNSSILKVVPNSGFICTTVEERESY